MKPMILVMALIMVFSLVYVYQGVSMHIQVNSEEDIFHELQYSYWNLDKATRDSAPTNSLLNNQLVEIKNYPSTLLKLKLVGVGKILTGIYILLFGILIALMMMPMKLGVIIKGKKK